VDRSAATSGSSRAAGLDGIRGLAALYVVLSVVLSIGGLFGGLALVRGLS